MVKDYYQILKIDPSANSGEIKAAYRKLALELHPDKNPDDQYALSQFYLVKEAYETLISPSLKEEYLKKRWLTKIYNQKFDIRAHNPERVLMQFLSAGKKIQAFDGFRMDKKGIEEEILLLLNSDNLSILSEFNDVRVNDEIIKQAVSIAGMLTPAGRVKIYDQLRKISGSETATALIEDADNDRRHQVIFDRVKPWLIALIVIFLCSLVYFVSRG